MKTPIAISMTADTSHMILHTLFSDRLRYWSWVGFTVDTVLTCPSIPQIHSRAFLYQGRCFVSPSITTSFSSTTNNNRDSDLDLEFSAPVSRNIAYSLKAVSCTAEAFNSEEFSCRIYACKGGMGLHSYIPSSNNFELTDIFSGAR